MNPSEEIDNLIAQNQDWRGATLAKLRKTILEVDPRSLRIGNGWGHQSGDSMGLSVLEIFSRIK